eukprot:SAG31_NODE_23338_length_506_cov_0.990172_1_plen_55_part_10
MNGRDAWYSCIGFAVVYKIYWLRGVDNKGAHGDMGVPHGPGGSGGAGGARSQEAG